MANGGAQESSYEVVRGRCGLASIYRYKVSWGRYDVLSGRCTVAIVSMGCSGEGLMRLVVHRYLMTIVRSAVAIYWTLLWVARGSYSWYPG